jgi:hypothetical protein
LGKRELAEIVFNEPAESFQSAVPLSGNLVEVIADFRQPPRFNLPQPISPGTLALDNAGILEQLQMSGI